MLLFGNSLKKNKILFEIVLFTNYVAGKLTFIFSSIFNLEIFIILMFSKKQSLIYILES